MKRKNWIIHEDFSTDKKKLLFYCGKLAMNGVATAFFSLLNAIDYNKYDVSVYGYKPKDPTIIMRINKNVRFLLNCSPSATTRMEKFGETYLKKYGLTVKFLK